MPRAADPQLPGASRLAKRIFMNRIAAGYPIGNPAITRQRAFTKADSLRDQILFKLLALVIFAVLLCLVYTGSRVQIVSLGYSINALKNEEVALNNENKKLRTELALLKSPERLNAFAQTHLNMATPSPERIQKVVSH
jgi:cell division protein FtsL